MGWLGGRMYGSGLGVWGWGLRLEKNGNIAGVRENPSAQETHWGKTIRVTSAMFVIASIGPGPHSAPHRPRPHPHPNTLSPRCHTHTHIISTLPPTPTSHPHFEASPLATRPSPWAWFDLYFFRLFPFKPFFPKVGSGHQSFGHLSLVDHGSIGRSRAGSK